MSRKHSTLLKEEVDDEETSGSNGEKKKREKGPDGGDRKKKVYKKGDKNEGYFNDSMTKSSNQKTSAMGGAAVNPTADTITSPVHTQQPGVIPPPLQPPPSSHGQRHIHSQQSYMAVVGNKQGYVTVVQSPIPVHPTHATPSNWQQQQQQQSMPQRLPPPPGATHAQMVQHPHQQQTIPHPPQAQYVTQVQHPQSQGPVVAQHQGGQVYQAHPPQQGYYPVVVQYPHGIPNQAAGYPGHPMVPTGVVHGQAVPDTDQTGWHSKAPQSPTNQGQVPETAWPQHTEGNWTGHPGTGDPGWNANMPGTVPDAHRDGNWAAFDGSTVEKPPVQINRKEITQTWRESPDNSSSDEEIELSSSPEMAGEEGEGLLRAPSLTSVEDEIEENPWQIQPDQQEYYMKQFQRLQPNQGGVIKGPNARDFFLKSNLPTEILSKVWHLSDINKDNALDLDEFCIAMHLVVAIRHGLELPTTLPDVLLYHRSKQNDLSDAMSENARHDSVEDNSTSQPININKAKSESSKDMRPRSLSDTSLNEDHHSEVLSRKTSVPATNTAAESSQGPLSPGLTNTVSIERPRATAKFSLLDSLPGQLLPPPSGKFVGWTPSKTDKDSDSDAESDDDDDSGNDSDDSDEPHPMSPGQTTPIPMPPLPEDDAKDDQNIPTPPSSPLTESPKPVLPDIAQVTRRLSKKSSERPKSAGDVNEMIPTPGSDSSHSSTPTNSSIGSDGKKEPPPPPPPRNKKGHSRSSSLDLNKLFAGKSKESRGNTLGSPTSSQSSHTSQSSEVVLPLKDEPKEEPSTTQTRGEETPQTDKKLSREENFADFSNFETLVKAQGISSDSQMVVPTQGCSHRRSMSLDQGQDYHRPQPSQPPTEGTTNGPSKIQEVLPRPVPKLKPPVSPPVKLLKLQTPKKEGHEERKLNTEPPKVVVKPLTKESKLQNSIRELKETNLLLSRLNHELQQENKEVMEHRISLELQLERLKSSKPANK